MKIKEKRMSKKEKIAKIHQMAEVELPELIAACQANPADENCKKNFEYAKVQMTLLIIEFSIGAHTVEDKNGQWHYTFRQKLPTLSEINEVCNVLDAYIDKYEAPYVTVTGSADDENNMGMPKAAAHSPEMFKLDKVTKKTLSDGISDHIRRYQVIDRASIMTLAEYGQKLRKRQNLYTTIIIGGIVVAIAGGIITGTYIYNKKKNESCDGDDIDINDDIVDISTDDIPVLEEQDVPVVDID